VKPECINSQPSLHPQWVWMKCVNIKSFTMLNIMNATDKATVGVCNLDSLQVEAETQTVSDGLSDLKKTLFQT